MSNTDKFLANYDFLMWLKNYEIPTAPNKISKLTEKYLRKLFITNTSIDPSCWQGNDGVYVVKYDKKYCIRCIIPNSEFKICDIFYHKGIFHYDGHEKYKDILVYVLEHIYRNSRKFHKNMLNKIHKEFIRIKNIPAEDIPNYIDIETKNDITYVNFQQPTSKNYFGSFIWKNNNTKYGLFYPCDKLWLDWSFSILKMLKGIKNAI